MVTSVIRHPSGSTPAARRWTGHRIEVGRRLWEVVAIAERDDAPPVATEQPQPPGHLVELGEVEREVVHVVFKLVDERPSAPMPDFALEEVRVHAAAPSPPARLGGDSISATSKPERHPSSWKP